MSPRARTSTVVALAFAATVVTLGCAQITQGGSNDAGTSGEGGAAPANGADPSADAGIKGDGCGIDGETGATLCAVTSLCPTVIVDRDVFPSCGFRIRGAQVDLLCACSGSLCPIGVFGTCAEAAALLSSQAELTVCAQVGEGRCTTGTRAQPAGGGTCDRGCLSECGGGAGCAELCGCP
jgi:hypothetical protein